MQVLLMDIVTWLNGTEDFKIQMIFVVGRKGESMSDLIYRQEAVKTMYDLCEDIDNESLHIDVIVDALENLPSAESKRHYCRECKWSRCHINLDKYGRSETYWHCLNWDSGTDEEGFCHEWERKEDG